MSESRRTVSTRQFVPPIEMAPLIRPTDPSHRSTDRSRGSDSSPARPPGDRQEHDRVGTISAGGAGGECGPFFGTQVRTGIRTGDEHMHRGDELRPGSRPVDRRGVAGRAFRREVSRSGRRGAGESRCGAAGPSRVVVSRAPPAGSVTERSAGPSDMEPAGCAAPRDGPTDATARTSGSPTVSDRRGRDLIHDLTARTPPPEARGPSDRTAPDTQP